MSVAQVTVLEALDAAVSAGRQLEWPRANPSRGLALIAPFAECEQFIDAQPSQSLGVRCIICAVHGDCHLALGQIGEAAGWYLRGCGYSKAGGCSPFFAPFYARMVVDHQLTGHYHTAIEALHAHYAAWRSNPFLTRLYWNIFTLWWLRPSQWRMKLRERRLLVQLSTLVEESESG